jgi:DNA-binding response OmpR family regulator
MAATALAATSSTSISELQSAPTERILIIEDDGVLRKILQRLFSLEGYEIEVVPDAVRGLPIVRHRVPAAVVLDLSIPGSSERDLCQKIANLDSWSIPGRS